MRNAVIGFNDGKWAHTDTEYDALGRVARRSEPYYDGATTDTHWTSFEYDLLGRVVKTVLPDDTSTLNSEITVTYAGLTTTTTNAKSQTQRETRNALDEVIKTRDHAGTTVSHTYNAWGQVKKTVVAGAGVSAVTTTMTYDKRGRRTQLNDPDRGTIKYAYNGFDELVKQTDARGHYQAMTYDGLGRMKTRKDYTPGPTAAASDDVERAAASWTWDGASNGLGQVQMVTDTESGYTRALTYDTLGRVSETAITPGTGAGTYHEKQTYDGYGRPYQHFDAARTSREWEDNVTEVKYNAYGYAYKWVDGVYENGTPKTTYREIRSQDARGNVTGEKLGGGALRTARTFDAKTGRITGITSKTALAQERQEFGYTWDVLGNLTTRTDTTGATGADGTRNLTEAFTYDTLNRLTSSRVGTGARRTVTYDALGNIKTKTGVGSYLYGLGSTGPHAVSFAGDATFTYDAAGNLTRENRAGTTTRSLDYTPFNKVSRIVKGNHTVTFAYGPERARYKRTDTSGSNTTTTLYVGSVEKVTHSGSLYEYKRYIAGGAALVTEKHETTVNNGVSTETETETTQYLLKDHLGSVAVITNALGAIDQELSYDAWGQRRHAATWGDLTAMARMSFDNSRTRRGFTGHEMVDAVGIIHMNGRIYDPNLGRFMQADPVIQFPDFSQSHNRYSYVLNNPLNATDPSGYFLKKLFRKVVGFALNGISEILFSKVPVLRQFSTLAYCLSGNPVQCGAAAAGNAYAGGASLKRALQAGVFAYVSAKAFTAVGDYFQGIDAVGGWGHFGAHALTGGILTELQGGEFGHGFLSAGVAFGVGQIGIKQGWSEGAQFVSRVVSAGTVSEITGGKFANGAVTAAFAFVYNDLKHGETQGVDYSDCGDGKECVVSNQGVRNELDKLNDQLVADELGHVSVSGGDSRYDPATGQSISNSTGEVIRGRSEGSFHNQGQNHRAVDIRGRTINMTRPELDRYIESHTGFKVLERVYSDGHIHIRCDAQACIND